MSNISAKPSPHYNFLFFKKKYKNNFSRKFIFFQNGRQAMLFGIEKLKLDKKKTILIPGYICYSFVEPLIKKGFKVEYYDVNENFSLDLKYFKKVVKNKNISALVVVHYFGFSIDIQEIYNFCNSINIELIEDYCHSFLPRIFSKNNKTLNTTKIYSFRKTIPITDGGAIENRNFRHTNISYNNLLSPAEFVFLVMRYCESLINRIAIVNLYCKSFQSFKKKIKNIKSIFNKEIFHGFEIISRNPSYMLGSYIKADKYLNKIFYKRRENYNFLFKEIKKLDFKIVFNKLSDHSAPQFFPILLNKENKLLFEYLNNKGIETIKWPDHEIPKIVLRSKKKFKNSNFFNENIILIPVHQSLSKNKCKRIVEVLKSFLDNDHLSK